MASPTSILPTSLQLVLQTSDQSVVQQTGQIKYIPVEPWTFSANSLVDMDGDLIFAQHSPVWRTRSGFPLAPSSSSQPTTDSKLHGQAHHQWTRSVKEGEGWQTNTVP